MSVSIRAAGLSDYDGLCALLEQVDLLHHEHEPGVFRAIRRPVREREYVRSVLEDPSARVFLADDGERLLGAVHVVLRETPVHPLLVPRRVGHVENLVVDAAARRQGVGRALMTAAENWARGQGASEIELTVYEFNQEALGFYRNLGYGTRYRRLTKTLSRVDGQ